MIFNFDSKEIGEYSDKLKILGVSLRNISDEYKRLRSIDYVNNFVNNPDPDAELSGVYRSNYSY